ncbi:tRNA (guanosine(46)-N7)-methyltransferase TrmB [Roseburia sp. MSJ-14]|uniref:tRNA (guanosine(46)-N7)-methyltransferase TrmB n=1 Tax=Roseburia sp. MSJ-14 TaxID=2841514 RepID=UPI001C12371D|nr:tRNA (guanosine(46)-N7)-methyltransferase TrmB [Roseburia sp. MSJ-14]MBU5474192.1 tRNA (guanosine(46)-N7)-methyltransferase TrmB [Roseburia sp. MSJ-14]
MRLRNIPGSREVIAENKWCIQEPEHQKGHWNEIFGNKHPIHIEIGMGKGQFITTLARQNPSTNYVGIEKYSSVLLRGLQKMEEDPLENIRFIRMDAETICEVFDKDEVSKIYLNFSDPWPKDRHAKRRLTSRQFFARYDQILKNDGVVEFKTDNVDLFDFSLEEVKEAHWNLDAFTRDLHHDTAMNEGNVMTEYEERFSAMGNPIHKLIASR